MTTCRFDKYLHQVFIDVGLYQNWTESKYYVECYDHNKEMCDNHGWIIKIWSENDCDELIELYYPNYLNVWNSFTHKFYKVDFIRPFILHHSGGCYMDMDNKLLGIPSLHEDYILCDFKNEIASDFFYFKDRRVYIDFIEFMWFRIKSCQMPDHWKTRRLQYMVGQKCFNQFCRINGYTNTKQIYHSYYTQSWLKAFDKKKILPIIKE